MSYSVAIFCPDTHVVYNLHTLDQQGIGGGITARLRMAHALAASGHSVTVYNHCPRRQEIRGVQYIPFTQAREIDAEVFIAGTSGGNLDLAPVNQLEVQSSLKILMVHGNDPPSGVDLSFFDYIYSLSNYVSGRIRSTWKVPGKRIFTSYRGVKEDNYRPLQKSGPERDPFGLVFLSHPSKGLSTALDLVDRLRKKHPAFNLHIYGGYGLWGDREQPIEKRPNVYYHGLLGQQELARELGKYSFAVFLQDREEPFGISLIESMKAGCIPLASKVGAYPELIENGVNGFLLDEGTPDSSSAAAAEIILGLIEDEADAARIRENARAAPLSWAEIASSWTGHWDDALDRREQPAKRVEAGSCPVCLEDLLSLADGRHCPGCGRYWKDTLPDD